MSFRIEDKLLINPGNLSHFYEFLNKQSAIKLFQKRIIKSLYFDNQNLQMYKDSIEGTVPRKKIRIRQYPNFKDENYYFEMKTSSVEGRFKTREIIDEEKFLFLQKYGYLDKTYGNCLPNFYVTYEREYSKIKDVRISIDTNITYRSYESNYETKDTRVVAELKTSIKFV